MLTLESLATIFLARNPVQLKFHATDVNGVAMRPRGASAVLVDNSTALGVPTLTQADFIKLQWIAPDLTEHLVEFKVDATYPVENQLPLFFADCAAIIAAHPLIAPHFRVKYDDSNDRRIIIEAKNTNANYLLSILINRSFATVYTYNYAPTTAPANYKAVVNLFFEKTYNLGDWEVVAQTELFLDDEGELPSFDIRGILSRECDRTVTENPFTRYSRTQPTLSDNVRRFYVQYKEQYTNSSAAWLSTSPIPVVMGGIPNRVFLQAGYEFFSHLNPLSKSMSYVPKTRIHPNQTAFISFFNPNLTAQAVKLETIPYNSLGQPITTITSASFSVLPRRAVTFPVSQAVLNYPDDVLFLSVRFVDAASLSPLSIARHFEIERDYSRSIRVLGYLNAFGLPETVHCFGDFTKMVRIERSQYAGTRTDSLQRAVEVTRQSRAVYRPLWTYRVGTLDAAQSEQLDEVEMSRVLFDLTDGQEFALSFKETTYAPRTETTDTSTIIYEREINVTPLMQVNNFTTDAVMFAAGAVENVVELQTNSGSGGTVIPIDRTVDGGSGGSGGGNPPVDPLDELGVLEDTDLMVFAKRDANGNFAGYGVRLAGKVLRHVRGLPVSATSHLDGIALKDDTGTVRIYEADTDGNISTP